MYLLSSSSVDLRPALARPAVPSNSARLFTAENRALRAERELLKLRERLEGLEGSSVSPPPTSGIADDSVLTALARADCTAALRVQAAATAAPTTSTGKERGAADLSLRRLSAICRQLAPAVAVRPAPLQNALSSRLVVQLSPWKWASSPARLEFDPDGLSGALGTPWGDGRWGALPRHPAVLWASFAGRDHLLWVRGSSIVSHRCVDNETVSVVTERGAAEASAFATRSDGFGLAAPAAASAAAAGAGTCPRALRLAPWTLWASASSGGLALALRSSLGGLSRIAAGGVGSLGRSTPTAGAGDGKAECSPVRWQCVRGGNGGEVLSFWTAGDGGLGANGTLVVRGDEMLLLSSSSSGARLPSAGRTNLLELATPRSAKLAFVSAGARARDDEADDDDDDEGEVDVGELG